LTLGPLKLPSGDNCAERVKVHWAEDESGWTRMKYRGIEYTVVQGIARQVWKWSVSVADLVITGRAATPSDAVTNAERAIDRALAPKKRRLVTSDIPRGKYIGEAVDPPKDERSFSSNARRAVRGSIAAISEWCLTMREPHPDREH
jgi:hypothetical protein